MRSIEAGSTGPLSGLSRCAGPFTDVFSLIRAGGQGRADYFSISLGRSTTETFYANGIDGRVARRVAVSSDRGYTQAQIPMQHPNPVHDAEQLAQLLRVASLAGPSRSRSTIATARASGVFDRCSSNGCNPIRSSIRRQVRAGFGAKCLCSRTVSMSTTMQCLGGRQWIRNGKGAVVVKFSPTAKC